MNDEPDPPSDQELQIELSRTRTLLALDRTLLAWVRTSLTLIGFGFTLAKFVHDLIAKGYLHGVDPEYPRQLGISMMVLGIVGLLGGAFDYLRTVKKLRTAVAMSPWSASLFVSILLAVISVLLMVSLVTNLSPH